MDIVRDRRFLHCGFASGRNDEFVVGAKEKLISPLHCEMTKFEGVGLPRGS